MQEEEFFQEKADTNIFKQIIYKYMPFWPLFIITTAISLVIAYIYLRSQIPVYVATARVLLKDPQRDGGDSKVLDALNIFSERKIVDNEIVVLESSDIMKEVVKDLDLYATVYNKGNVRTEELYGANSPLKFIAANKDSFYLWGNYFFSINWHNKTITIDNKTIDFNDTLDINNNKLFLKINPDYNQNVVGKNFFVSFAPPENMAIGLASSLKIAPYSYQSSILNVSTEIRVPQKGTDMLTKLFEIYNIDAIEDENEIADKTLQFIDDRLNLLQTQLDSVEKSIAAYKAKESVVDLSSQASAYLDKVKDLDKAQSDIDLKLEALDNINDYIKSKGKKTGTVPSLILLSDPTLGGLLEKL